MNKMIMTFFSMLIISLICTGCENTSMDELVPANDITYNKIEKNTVVVEKGDITPVFDKPLELAGYEEKKYREDSDEYEALKAAYELTLKSVNCEVGQKVKKGDVLVSFTSKELDGQIKEKQEEKRLAALELEHIKKLAKINDTENYDEQMESIKQQIKICDLYIQDISDKYNEINIVCEEDGVVRYIDSSLFDGYVATNSDLIIVSKDDGYYETEVDNTVSFDAEKTYEAGSGATKYELAVLEKVDGKLSDEKAENNERISNTNEKKEPQTHVAYFKPINNNGQMLEKSIRLETELNTLKDVCYVDKQAIIRMENAEYVYMVDDEGKRRAVKVITGDVVDNYCIILDGLSGGERVALP
ncbi:MAG: hypothetical protein K6G76_01770 [Lachnospiraceae bacterium]|nr:hypothetical protein [Lachnospiraceae bacterium]